MSFADGNASVRSASVDEFSLGEEDADLDDLIDERFGEYRGPAFLKKTKGRYSSIFKHMLDCLEFEDKNAPLTSIELQSPNNKAVCTIMYLYSMDTPFCRELANISKVNKDKLYQLGPFDRCLQEILNKKTEVKKLIQLMKFQSKYFSIQ